MIQFLLTLITLFACATARADFEALSVTHRTDKLGRPTLCYKPFLERRDPNCVVVQSVTPAEKLKDDPDLDLTEVNLTEYADDARANFAAVIEWKGNAKGSLRIAGPAGKIFAIGHLQEGEIKLDYFSDEALSQQFDRASLFGESSPERLHVSTEVWLERILLPAIQRRLAPAQNAKP